MRQPSAVVVILAALAIALAFSSILPGTGDNSITGQAVRPTLTPGPLGTDLPAVPETQPGTTPAPSVAPPHETPPTPAPAKAATISLPASEPAPATTSGLETAGREAPTPPTGLFTAAAPTVDSISVVSSNASNNYTFYNLTATISTSDGDGDPVSNITVWYRDDIAIPLFYRPMDWNTNVSIRSLDYGQYNLTGTVVGANWTRNSGHDGSGAYYFNNSNQYISGSYFSSIYNNFAMEAWVKPTSNITVLAQATSGTAGTGGQRFAIAPVNAGANSGAGISVGRNAIQVCEHGSAYLPCLLSYTITISDWTHVLVTYTNKQPKLYVNGVLVHTGLTSVRPAVHPSYQIGYVPNYGPYNGSIGMVRIWNRSLTAAEIALLAEGKDDVILPAAIGSNFGIWKACVTPNDGTSQGEKVCSNNVSVRSAVGFDEKFMFFNAERGTTSIPIPVHNDNQSLAIVVANTSSASDDDANGLFRGPGAFDTPLYINDSERYNLTFSVNAGSTMASNVTWNATLTDFEGNLLDTAVIVVNLTPLEGYSVRTNITPVNGESKLNITVTDKSSADAVCGQIRRTFSIQNNGAANITDLNMQVSGALDIEVQPLFERSALGVGDWLNVTVIAQVNSSTPSSSALINITAHGVSTWVNVSYASSGGGWPAQPGYTPGSVYTATTRQWYIRTTRHGENLYATFSAVIPPSIAASADSATIFVKWWGSTLWGNNCPRVVSSWYSINSNTFQYATSALSTISVPTGLLVKGTNYIRIDWAGVKNTRVACFPYQMSMRIVVNENPGTNYCPLCVPTEDDESNFLDGLDNDCDGWIDCKDSDSCGSPSCDYDPSLCAVSEVCTDGADNDGNGLTDCNDVDVCCDNVACSGQLQCRGSDCGATPRDLFINRNINTSGTCFTVAAHGITIDCQGRQINYSTGNVGFGVFSRGYDNVIVRNCRFVDKNNVNGWNSAINVTHGRNALIENNVIDITQISSYGAISVYNLTNATIRGNNVSVNGSSATGILTRLTSNLTIENNLLFVNDTVQVGYHQPYGIFLATGDKGTKIVNNTIRVIGTVSDYTPQYQCADIWAGDSMNLLIQGNNLSSDIKTTSNQNAWNILLSGAFNTTIDGNVMFSNNSGINFHDSNNTRVYNNSLIVGKGIGMDLQCYSCAYPGQPSYNTQIIDNRLQAYTGSVTSLSANTFFCYVQHIVVENNTVRTGNVGLNLGRTASAVYVGNLSVKRNTIYQTGIGSALSLALYISPPVEGNIIYGQPYSSGTCAFFTPRDGSGYQYFRNNSLLDCSTALTTGGDEAILANNTMYCYGSALCVSVGGSNLKGNSVWHRTSNTVTVRSVVDGSIMDGNDVYVTGTSPTGILAQSNNIIRNNQLLVKNVTGTTYALQSNSGVGGTIENNSIIMMNLSESYDKYGLIVTSGGVNMTIANNSVSVVNSVASTSGCYGLNANWGNDSLVMGNDITVSCDSTYPTYGMYSMDNAKARWINNVIDVTGRTAIGYYQEHTAALFGNRLVDNLTVIINASNGTGIWISSGTVNPVLSNATYANISVILRGNSVAGVRINETGSNQNGPRNITLRDVQAFNDGCVDCVGMTIGKANNISVNNLQLFNTTDWLQVRVGHKIRLENTTFGWQASTARYPDAVWLWDHDLSGARLRVGNDSVYLDGAAVPPFNTTAIITWPIVLSPNAEVVLRATDGSGYQWCEPSVCSIVRNETGNNEFQLNVAHFTNYSIQDGVSTNLTIWDGNDGGMPYNSTKRVDEQVAFYANFTNNTGQPANTTDGACTIDIADPTYDGYDPMGWNEAKQLFTFNYTFTTNNTFLWKVNCSWSGQEYENLEVQDDINIAKRIRYLGKVPEFGTWALLAALGLVAGGVVSMRARGSSRRRKR